MHKQVFRVNGNLCRIKRKGKGFYEIKALIKGNLYVFKVDIIAKDDNLKLYDVNLDKVSIWTIEALAQNGFGVYVDEGKPFSTDDYRKPLTSAINSTTFTILTGEPIMENENKQINDVNPTEKVVDITTLNVVNEEITEATTVVKEEEAVTHTVESNTSEEPIKTQESESPVQKELDTPSTDNGEISTFSTWGSRVMKAAVVGATGYLLYRTVKYILED